MKTLTKTRAVEGSLVITIPRGIVEIEELKEGDVVELDVHKTKKSFFGIAKGIGSFASKDELVAHD